MMRTETSKRPNVKTSTLAHSAHLVLLAIMAIVVQPAIAEESGWSVVDEYWYTVKIGGEDAGWLHSTTEARETRYRTSLRMTMRIGRGEQVVELTGSESFIETHEGEPIRMTMQQIQGNDPVTHEWDFTGEQILHTVTQRGRTRTNEHQHSDDDWLTPVAADRYVRERRNAGENEITFRTVTPETGIRPTTITTTRAGEDTLTVKEREMAVTVWTTVMDAMPIGITEYIASDGTLVYQSVPMGPASIEMTLASREKAMAAAQGNAPELLVGLLVTPDKPIENASETERVKLRLRVRDGAMPALPEAGGQRFEMAEDGRSAIVIMHPGDPLPASPEDIGRAAYREPSTLVDFDDDTVRTLIEAMSAEVNSIEQREAARLLQEFVYRHIESKTLDTAFGSASDAARNRRGDCTEHAVLLAALLRGHDIPARVATGLVYADHFVGEQDIFGWHMWTQALIDGHWLDFDAVLPNQSHHAAYILTGVSGLDDASRLRDRMAGVQLIGNLDIEVLDVTYRD